MRISDWSSDVCSSDLQPHHPIAERDEIEDADDRKLDPHRAKQHQQRGQTDRSVEDELARARQPAPIVAEEAARPAPEEALRQRMRSEEHTSELQSLMRISYAVFCLKTKKKNHNHTKH